jgi:diguanylate cyclase (GGDEF)-like protein
VNPQLEERLRYCKNLPTIPAIAMRVVELAGQPEVGLPDIAQLISRDPGLSIKVLKVANSPLYGFRRKTDNLRQAMNVLGLNAVITLSLSFSLAGSLRDIERTGFDTEHYWRRSVIAAIAARALGTQLGMKTGDELMLAGLLQDIGMLVFHAVLQEEYHKVVADKSNHNAVIDAERRAFGADHAEAGAWLIHQWNLPDYLQQLIAASHAPNDPAIPSELSSMANCVALSGLIADAMLHPDNDILSTQAVNGAEEFLGMDANTYRSALDLIAASLPEVSEIFEIKPIEPLQTAVLQDQANEIMMIRHLRMHEEVNQVRRIADELATRSQILEDQVHKDSLTGLYNRGHFDAVLHKEFIHATEQDWSLSVAFIDLDNFKQVNDSFGHKVGDEILKSIADVMRSHTRQSDILARYGGEEFVAILPGTNAAGACKLFERIIAAVRALDHAGLTNQPLFVTLSIGVATHMDDGKCFDTASELLQAADDAMYAAKNAGRNRLIVHADQAPGKQDDSLP